MRNIVWCPQCKFIGTVEENDFSETDCPQCGKPLFFTYFPKDIWANLRKEDKDIFKKQWSKAATPDIICPNCGQEIPEHSKYCLWCGEKIRKPGRCSNCLKDIPKDSAFCPFCGASIEEIL